MSYTSSWLDDVFCVMLVRCVQCECSAEECNVVVGRRVVVVAHCLWKVLSSALVTVSPVLSFAGVFRDANRCCIVVPVCVDLL